MRFILWITTLSGLLALAPVLPVRAATDDSLDEKTTEKQDQQKDKKEEKEEKETAEELTLERLFPEKSFFGPSARATAFSHDGRYAAYLYRPYIERRHGSDLWIYDVKTGESRRITSVSVMAEFQQATRKVREDRIKKAKKKRKAEKGKNGSKTEDKSENSQPGIIAEVSGQWQGLIKGGGEELGLPPEGLPFMLHLEVRQDGSVAGTIVAALTTATITDGNYDTETATLTCTFTEPDSGTTAVLSATIKGDTMKGKVTVESLGVTLDVTADRTAEYEDSTDANDADDSSADHADKDDTEAGKKDDTGDKKKEKEIEEEKDLGDVVLEDDADDKKAPRYGGVNSFSWAPEADELIFVSGGDLYRFFVDSGEIERLTRTKESEFDVQYLPDGSGYTFRRGGGVMKVVFGSSLIMEIDPKLPGGESMDGYRLSPDGNRMVFLTSTGWNWGNVGRKINIVNYRNRFAQVTQVPRHMSDDPFPDVSRSVYLYDLQRHFDEVSKLHKVYSRKLTGPRDVINVPQWSEDSTKIAFASYEQKSGLVTILESAWPYPEEKAEDNNSEETDETSPGINSDGENNEDAAAENADDSQQESAEKEKTDENAENKDEAEEPTKPEDARVIYRFLHNGGPTTPDMIRPQYLDDNKRLVFVTEISGFRHLHVLDPTYEQLDQLTRGRFEVYPLRMSHDRCLLFVTSTKENPAQRNIYKVDLHSGEMVRLDDRDGTFSTVAVSDDGEHVLANFVDYGFPRELLAWDVPDGETKILTDSHTEEAHKLTKFIPEYFNFENRHGQTIYGRMFKPDDWSPEDKRPLIIYVYGGPLGTTKMITRGSFSSSSYFFHYYMAKKHGYVTCTIDPRGASGFGGLFEKSNYEQVGKPQVEDLVDCVNWFVENQGVDPKRVGVHGWSFGGFQTQMCMYTQPDVFACGIAGAGPTEWENYNSWYSTGTVGPSRTGKTDLARFSLLPLAKNLKGHLLLIHGMEDSNVLYQDTVRVYRELLKAGKETLVDLFLDPTGGHGLGGDVKTIGRMR
ncbi:MAG TPA: S9 family peptidase, partial [Phycisphaeraceae bacterium]|nr:S9 family peptidase [Phycisphaeraceae bacterium]